MLARSPGPSLSMSQLVLQIYSLREQSLPFSILMMPYSMSFLVSLPSTSPSPPSYTSQSQVQEGEEKEGRDPSQAAKPPFS